MTKSIMKKFTIVSTFLIMFMGTCVSVNADGNYYDSTINIAHNSTLIGSIREYSYDNHKIKVTPTTLEYDFREGFRDRTRLDIKLKRPLFRLGIRYGTQTKFTGYQDYYKKDVAVTTKCGTAGKGKRYYEFSTWTGNNEGTGLMKGNIRMESYS